MDEPSAASWVVMEDFLGAFSPTRGRMGLSGDICLRPSGSEICNKMNEVSCALLYLVKYQHNNGVKWIGILWCIPSHAVAACVSVRRSTLFFLMLAGTACLLTPAERGLFV